MKGRIKVDAGAFYAPYIPQRMHWEQTLKLLGEKYRVWKLSFPNEVEPEQQITEVMQESFPGPYIVEEYFDSDKQRFDIRLKFEDPKQEMLWKIKWS